MLSPARLLWLFTAALLSTAPPLSANPPFAPDAGLYLVKDLNTRPAGQGITGRGVIFKDVYYYPGNSTETGTELWRSDGTTQGTHLLKDLTPGPEGSKITVLAATAAHLYFGRDGDLWRTNGTAEGTSRVADLAPDTLFGESAGFGPDLYFSAGGPNLPKELWKSDGTEAGTGKLREVDAPYESTLFTVAGSSLFFRANDDLHGMELWKTDGTGPGTVRVKDIQPGRDGSFPNSLTTMNGTLYFSANSDVGYELWKSDGTAAGTVMVHNFNYEVSGDVANLCAVGGTLYFTGNDGQAGQLWRTDGTASGTTRVSTSFYNASGLRRLGPGKIVFGGYSPQAGLRLWVSDGTSTGTVPIASMSGSDFRSAGNRVFFINRTSGQAELWVTEGTTFSTRKLGEFESTPTISDWDYLAAGNGRAFFAATSARHATELWTSDGTESGTIEPVDAYTATGNAFSATDPILHAEANQQLFLRATDGTASTHVFLTNGTAMGTGLLPFPSLSGQEAANPQAMVSLGDHVLFTRSGTSSPLWITSGPGGIQEVYAPDLTSVSGLFYSFGGAVLFAGTGSAGTEPWFASGNGATMLGDLNPGAGSSSPMNFCMMDGAIFFAAYTPASGWEPYAATPALNLLKNTVSGGLPSNPPEFPVLLGTELLFFARNAFDTLDLWITEGTAETTTLRKTLGATAVAAAPLVVEGRSYFSLQQPGTGYEPWVSDGTAAGTFRLKDIAPGAGSGSPTDFTAFGAHVYFSATGTNGETELWRTDGTAAGTVLFKDLNPAGSSFPHRFKVLAGTLYFTAEDAAHGRELWKSDGTVSGTVLLADLDPGPASSDPTQFLGQGDVLYFVAGTAAFGRELWRSDGTAPGTLMIDDLAPGTPSAFSPATGTKDDDASREIFSSLDRVFAVATNPRYGRELHVVGQAAPVILAQPADVTLRPGEVADVSITTDSETAWFEWYLGEQGDTSTLLGYSNRLLIPPPLSTLRVWVRITLGNAYVDSRTVVISVRYPREIWNEKWFGAHANNPQFTGDYLDPDQDGAINLLEYALGSNPMHAGSIPQPATGSVEINGETFLTLRYRQVSGNYSGILYQLQESPDLDTWHEINSYGNAISPVEDAGDGYEWHEVRASNPVTSGPGFLRMGVTAVP